MLPNFANSNKPFSVTYVSISVETVAHLTSLHDPQIAATKIPWELVQSHFIDSLGTECDFDLRVIAKIKLLSLIRENDIGQTIFFRYFIHFLGMKKTHSNKNTLGIWATQIHWWFYLRVIRSSYFHLRANDTWVPPFSGISCISSKMPQQKYRWNLDRWSQPCSFT